MNQNCQDVFRVYELPFETYFARAVEHMNQIHDETELIWIMRGRATIDCDDVKYEMIPRTLFMVNAFQKHSIMSGEGTIIITFRFRKEYLDNNKLSFKGMKFKNRIYSFDELALKYKEVPLLIAQLLQLLISSENSHLVRYKITGYYMMLIYELYTLLLKEKYLDVKQKNINEYLKRLNIIIDYVSQNFTRKITLDQVAELTGISRFRLSHFIREHMGISFMEFLTYMRFENALRLLRDSNMKVMDISRASGFSDVKYLNRLVRERFKMTALKYRKMVRETKKSRGMDVSNRDLFFQELKICLRKYKPEQEAPGL